MGVIMRRIITIALALRRFAFGICVTVGGSAGAGAATIEAVAGESGAGEGGQCQMMLYGDIMQGDKQKLLGVLRALRGDAPVAQWNATLCLNSFGGEIDEAIEMGSVALNNRVKTRILAGHECYSACAILFMTGTSSSRGYTHHARTLSAKGALGFHAPKPPSINGTFDSAQAYDAAIEQIGRRLFLLANQRTIYWKHPLIKARLINTMMLTSHTKLYLIDTVGRAAENEIALDDMPAVQATELKHIHHLCLNALAENFDLDLGTDIFRAGIKKYEKGPKSKAERLSDDVHTITWNVKISGCEAGLRGAADALVVSWHGGPRSATVNAPHWFALHPSTPIGKDATSPPDCGSPKYARLGALCSMPVFRQMEDEWAFIKRTKSGFAYYREFEGAELHESREAAWRAEVGKCIGEYICTFNAYTSWLKKFNFGLDPVFFRYQ